MRKLKIWSISSCPGYLSNNLKTAGDKTPEMILLILEQSLQMLRALRQCELMVLVSELGTPVCVCVFVCETIFSVLLILNWKNRCPFFINWEQANSETWAAQCAYKNFLNGLLCCISGKLIVKTKHKPELTLLPKECYPDLKKPHCKHLLNSYPTCTFSRVLFSRIMLIFVFELKRSVYLAWKYSWWSCCLMWDMFI